MSPLDVSTWRQGSHLPLAFGLLRLATEGRPDESEAIALIHEALDAGIRWIDTASSYCLDERDKHYGERLAITAWNTWSGPKEEVVIATKVGMSRPKGKWVPDGSGKSIRKTVEGSLAAMNMEQLPMVQLHVRDPRSPFVESLETLAELQADGKIQEIGLCNVGPLEMEQANRYFRLASVQNELSVVSRAAASDGSLALAERLNIPFFAYRPLGGHAKVSKLASNRTLAPLAKKHGVHARTSSHCCSLRSRFTCHSSLWRIPSRKPYRYASSASPKARR